MNSKNRISHRSCSAVPSRTTRTSKNSITGSLTNLSNTRKKYISPTVTAQNRNNYSKNQDETVVPSEENACFCSLCIDLDDITNSHIPELKNKLQNLKLEIINEKSKGQLLKRNILVAKKVIEKEIASNTEDFETLLERANSKSWKGRQEIILALKRKLRYLKELLDSVDGGTESVWARRKTKHKTEGWSKEISDDRKLQLCLEVERREVLKNAERYRQKFVVSRNRMENNLKRLKNKNDGLIIEARVLREKLSTASVQIDEELIKRLNDIKNQLKIKLEKKSNNRRQTNIIEQDICRNTKIIEELKKALDKETQILIEKRAKLKSLKEEKMKLQAASEAFKKEKLKRAAVRKKKLEDVEHGYDKIAVKSENLLKQLTGDKYLREKRKLLQLNKNPTRFVRKAFSFYPTDIIKDHSNYQYEEDDYSQMSEEIPNYSISNYKDKLLKYQTIFEALSERNEDKITSFFAVINETNEGIFELLENRYFMWQLTSDVKTLNRRYKKLKRSVLCLAKQKPVKKKTSSQQMMGIISERRTYLAIRKKESKFLKLLISDVLTSKENDCDMLLQGYLTKNKNLFQKKLSYIMKE